MDRFNTISSKELSHGEWSDFSQRAKHTRVTIYMRVLSIVMSHYWYYVVWDDTHDMEKRYLPTRHSLRIQISTSNSSPQLIISNRPSLKSLARARPVSPNPFVFRGGVNIISGCTCDIHYKMGWHSEDFWVNHINLLSSEKWPLHLSNIPPN